MRDPDLDPRHFQRHGSRLITHIPELGTLTGSQAASLAGLAPLNRESGTWKGRSFIQGGRHKVRRMLYMPALAVIRVHIPWTQVQGAGCRRKPPKVAITAVMRKLLVLANVLVPSSDGYAGSPFRSACRCTHDSSGSLATWLLICRWTRLEFAHRRVSLYLPSSSYRFGSTTTNGGRETWWCPGDPSRINFS